MKIYVQNTLNGLVPLNDSDLDNKKKLKLGETYRVDIVRPRNVRFHKKFFALLNVVWENLPEQISNDLKRFENFRSEIIKGCGFVETYVNVDGEIQERPLSMSFAKMSEEQFEELYSKTIDVILQVYLEGVERADLEREVLSFV